MRYFVFLIAMIICSVTLAKPPIYTNSLDDAMALQKNIDHDILLIFSSNNCVYCNLLKEDLPEMGIENKIICIIDINNTNNKNIKKLYDVSIIPDTRIISGGKQLKKIVGYKNKITYIELLK